MKAMKYAVKNGIEININPVPCNDKGEWRIDLSKGGFSKRSFIHPNNKKAVIGFILSSTMELVLGNRDEVSSSDLSGIKLKYTNRSI